MFAIYRKDTSVNATKFAGHVWCGLRAERLTVVLNHVRKLVGTHLKQCAAKLTGLEFIQLKEVIDMVQPKLGTQQGEEMLALTNGEEEEAGPSSSARTLKKEISDISLDDLGLPKCFGDNPDTASDTLTKGSETLTKGSAALPLAKVSFLRRRPGKSLPSSSSTAKPEELKKAMGIGGGKKKPKKKVKTRKLKSLTKGKQARPLTKGPCFKRPAAREPWAKILKTVTKKEPFRGRHTATGKMHLIVQTTKAGHASYKEILQEIEKRLEQDHLTKEEAVQLRDQMYESW